MGVGPGFYRCIVARPVFDNRVAGATTAESENCPWSSQFGFEFTVDFRLGQIARIGSTASAPSNAGNPRTSSRSWHLPILRSYSSKSWSVPRFSLPTWCRAKAIGKALPSAALQTPMTPTRQQRPMPELFSPCTSLCRWHGAKIGGRIVDVRRRTGSERNAASSDA